MRSIFLLCIASLLPLSPMLALEPASLVAAGTQPVMPSSSEEAFAIRRIAEFWKDKEYSLVKRQVWDFLDHYPQSPFCDKFRAILGDILTSEGRFEEALKVYDSITSAALPPQTLANRFYCLYELRHYAELEKEVSPLLESGLPVETKIQQAHLFYHAEALFRQSIDESDPAVKNRRMQEAKFAYEKLQGTSYGASSLSALGDLYRVSGDPKKASELYFSLAETQLDHKEQFLFKAAMMQSLFAPEGAVKTFNEVSAIGGSQAAEANFNRLVLLFDLERYSDIVEEGGAVISKCAPDKVAVANYIIGKSYFSLGNYEKALEHLNVFVAAPVSSPSQVKIALLSIMACGYHLKNIAVVESAVLVFEKSFPGDIDQPRALFLEALTYKDSGKEAEARIIFQSIVDGYPAFEDIEAVVFERDLLLAKPGSWQACHDAFLDFTRQYPRSVYLPHATRQLLKAASYRVEEIEAKGEEGVRAREQLVNDIAGAVATAGVLDPKQEKDYRLKLARTLHDLGEYSKALEEICAYLSKYAETPNLYQAHLLAALCYQKQGGDPEAFAFHGEQVLILKSDLPEKDSLHLNLFNAYLQLSKKQESKEIAGDSKAAELATQYLNKAAEHLYAVIGEGDDPVQSEHRLWLANYYYISVDNFLKAHWQNQLEASSKIHLAEKSVKLFQQALGVSSTATTIPILTADNLYLESEVFKLAQLLGWMSKKKEQLSLLEQLRAQQEASPELHWTLQARTQLFLAEAYESSKNNSKARVLYEALAKENRESDTYATSSAKLHLARLIYSAPSVEQEREDDPQMVTVLKLLKDLQIRKYLPHEPIHLEAAIEYAEIRSNLEPQPQRDAKLVFMLTRVRQDFSNQEDLWAKDYYASRQEMPDKDVVYQAYMMWLDARIAQLQAHLAKSRGALSEVESKEFAARTIFSALVEGRFAVSEYLVAKAKVHLNELESTN